MNRLLTFAAALLMSLPLMSGAALAQFQIQLGQAQSPGGGPPKPWGGGPGMMRDRGMGMGGGFGMWWKSPDVTQKLSLTDDQQQKIDRTFQDFRPKLIDLHAELEKQEGLLRPLVDADQPDEAKVMAQVDRVAQARAALERSNAAMMLAIRRVLTADQWKKLQERSPERRHFRDGEGPPPKPPGGDGDD